MFHRAFAFEWRFSRACISLTWMLVDVRLAWISWQFASGRQRRLCMDPARDAAKLKLKLTLWSVSTAQTASLKALASGAVVVDRGHLHTFNQVVVCIWHARLPRWRPADTHT